jgi:hypothetical protein
LRARPPAYEEGAVQINRHHLVAVCFGDVKGGARDAKTLIAEEDIDAVVGGEDPGDGFVDREVTSRTSSSCGCTVKPLDRASVATDTASASVRTVGTATAPVSASMIVSSRPKPFGAPVTTMTRSLRSKRRAAAPSGIDGFSSFDT